MQLPIDFHTHKTGKTNHIQVSNYIVKAQNSFALQGYFSAGIHPWYIDEPGILVAKLEEIAKNKNCVAIGECGLDKVCGTSLALQFLVFNNQCKLAVETQKPMIIHCVKAHFDVIGILQKNGVKKAVFHGFNSRYTLLEKILQEGFDVSFGAAIMQPKSQAATLIKMVPPERFFLETDDSPVGIDEIYKTATDILNIDEKELITQQHLNFNNFTA